MNLLLTSFAMISAALTVSIFYYNIIIVKKFREDEELTATKLVIKENIPDAFMSLSISSLMFSFGSFLGASIIILDLDLFGYFSELGIITMLVGLLTFMKRISDSVTEGEKNEVENEERKGEQSKEEESKEEKED